MQPVFVGGVGYNFAQEGGSLVFATHFGWSPQCGGSRSSWEGLANRDFVKEIRAAPARIAGRGGAIRLTTGGG